jgi:Rieske Fe-S protein
MRNDAEVGCDGCTGRRTLLKLGLAGAGLLVLPAACIPAPDSAANGQGAQGGEGAPPGSGSGGSPVDGPVGQGGGTDGGSGRDTGGARCSTLSAGDIAAAAVGSLQIVASAGGAFVLGRDAGGLYAMSSACTHAGRGLTVVGGPGSNSLVCPLHGSSFNSDGGVTGGPASTPLLHYPVQAEPGGGIRVCLDMTVPSNTRTTVP